MGTYNGGKYIAEQLDSIQTQTHQNWRLIVSDDGSTDNTLDIVKNYQIAWGAAKLEIRQGPQNGFAENFLSMACDPSIKADYYAFSDQDDVWLPEKLERAILRLANGPDAAQIYCGRTIYATEQLKQYGLSPDFAHPPSFRNALVQSIAGGNTMVFNQKAKALIEKAGCVDVPSHDWWAYILVTASDGIVHFDNEPLVVYRQHPNGLVGENQSFGAKLERARMVFNGQLQKFISQNCSALSSCSHLINTNNHIWLQVFEKMRASHAKDRFRLLEICGLYRQTWRGTLTFLLAAVLRKL